MELYEFVKALIFSTLCSVYLVATSLSIRFLCVITLGEKIYIENKEIIALLGLIITFGSCASIIIYCINRQKKIDEKFIVACKIGDMYEVIIILNKNYIDRADIHADNDKGFREACYYGHLEVVKYLLTSPDLKEYANIHADNDAGFRWACARGHLDVIKYLLTSPDLKEHANIHADDDDGFRLACANGHLQLVKYLLTSPELKEHANIHANNDESFIRACEKVRLEVVKFHVFDMNFQLSLETRKKMNSLDIKDEIFNLFVKRDFERQLQSGLKVKIQDEKPVKRAKI